MVRMMLAFLPLVALVGCSGGPADEFKGPRGQVAGKITFKGEPIPDGSTVMFQSKGGKHTYTALGMVTSNGEYTLLYKGSAEVPSGDFLVQVSPPSKPASTTPKGPGDMINAAKSSKEAAEKPPFPARYNTASTSKLEFTINAGKNTADFELTE